MNADSGLTGNLTLTRKRINLNVALIMLFLILSMRYIALPAVKIGGEATLSLDVFLFFFLIVASSFGFLMMRKSLEKEFLFVFLFPCVGIFYVGYGLFIEHNDAHRAFFEYQPIMFYLSSLFPLVFLRADTDAEFVLKGIVYSCIAFIPVLLLQQLFLTTGYVFLPGKEEVGKEWLGQAGRFVPAAQDVVLLVSFYAYRKAVRTLTTLNLIIAALFVFSLLITFSRNIWISYITGIAFISWYERRFIFKKYYTIFVLVSVVMAAVFYLYESGLGGVIINRLGMISVSAVSTDMSLKWRLYETEKAIEAVMTTPVMGHGLGYMYHRPRAFESSAYYIHNNYLFLWVKMGLPGLFAMLAFIVVFIKTALAVYKDYDKNDLISGVAISSAAYMTAMVFVVVVKPSFVLDKGTIILVSVIYGVFAYLKIYKRKNGYGSESV